MIKKLKRNGIIITAFILVLTSIILLINKDSYANQIGPMSDNCPYTINKLNIGKEEISLLQDSNNKISLPMENSTFIDDTITRSISYDDIGFFYITSMDMLEKENENYLISYYSFQNYGSSLEMGYILDKVKFSNDTQENRYYKQIFIFYYMDYLFGYDIDKNYAKNGNLEEELPYDNNYQDKFYTEDEIRDWKYLNNLSAHDKDLIERANLKEQMDKYVEEVENYYHWVASGNLEVVLDSIAKDNISYHITDEYIETNLMKPSSKETPYEKLLSEYEVEVNSPWKVVDSRGNERTKFTANESFRIRINKEDLSTNTMNYNVEIKATFNLPITMTYNARTKMINTAISREGALDNKVVVENCLAYESLETTTSFSNQEQLGTLSIKVIDIETKENLSNAEVTIYDEKNKVVYQTTTNGEVISLKLPIGKYSIKQTVTPPNYQARVSMQEIDLTNNSNQEVILDNIPIILVPDTNKTVLAIQLVGGLILIIGALLIISNLKKKQKIK